MCTVPTAPTSRTLPGPAPPAKVSGMRPTEGEEPPHP